MSLSKISKFNVATLLMVLLAACLLSPFCFFVPSAPSAVTPNDVASSCVISDHPFFNPKVCPLEEEVSLMVDYHYGVAVETPSLPSIFSWFSKTISTFSFSSEETLAFLSATSTSWLLDMEMKIYTLLHSSESNAIENMGEYRRSLWFTFLNKVNFAEFIDYWSAEMMSAFDHSLDVLQKIFLELYSTLTSYFYDISAWTLHLPTVTLRDIPTAFYDKSSELLRSFQSSDALVLTKPGSHPALSSSVQPCFVDLLIDSPVPFITEAAPINVTPTGNTTDWRKALVCVASGLVGVDESVSVSSPGFFVLHPPMFFTIRTTLDSVMAPGEQNHMLAVNFNLVAIVIALLSTLAVRVMVNQVIQGVKSVLLHQANWKGASYIISLELYNLPAFANHHESCESLSSLGSASGEAITSTEAAPQLTPSSFQPVSSDSVADLPVSSSEVTAAPSNTTMIAAAGKTDPLAKVVSLRRKLYALRSRHLLRRRLRNLRQYRLQASRKKAVLSELLLSLSTDSFSLRPVSSADVTAAPSRSEKTTQGKTQGVAFTTTTVAAGKTKHRLATKALMKEIRSCRRIGNHRMHYWLRFSLGEVPTAASYESNRFRLAVQSPEKAVSIASSGDLSNQTKPVLYQLERDVVFWMFRSR